MFQNPTVSKIIGKTFKYLFLAFVLFINVAIIFRMCSSGEPSSMKVLMVNDKTLTAYEQYGDDITMFYQNQYSITRADTNSGYFSVESVVFIPEAQQVQVLVRYNNSTIDALATDYNLDTVPERDEELFDVTLFKTIDLTPDDTEDNDISENLSSERYFPSEKIKDTKTVYNYYKYIFDGVSSEDAVGIFVDIYYNQNIDYEKSAYGTLCIYDNQSDNITYKLTSADKKALQTALESK